MNDQLNFDEATDQALRKLILRIFGVASKNVLIASTLCRVLEFQLNALEGADTKSEVVVTQIMSSVYENGDGAISCATIAGDDHLLEALTVAHTQIDDAIKIVVERLRVAKIIEENSTTDLTKIPRVLN